MASAQDPAGNTVAYGYDSAGLLSSVTYPNGDTQTYSYPSGTALLSAIDVNGVLYRSFSYNSGGSVHQSSYGSTQAVQAQTFAYAVNANNTTTTTVTDAAGATTTYTYGYVGPQNQLKLTQVTTTGVAGVPDATITIAYDSNGHPTRMVDARGIATDYSYSADGLLQDEITGLDPNNPGQQREAVYTWDTTHDRITDVKRYGASQSDPISDTAYTYAADSSAAKNRIESVAVTNLTANGSPNQTQTTTWSYAFYSTGMPSAVTVDGPLAGAGGHLEADYDTQGNLTRTADGLGFTTTYSSYNALGLRGTVTDPNGYTASFAYDRRGRLTSVSRVVNGVTATTSFLYDPLGGVAQVRYPDGGFVNTNYDSAGRPTAVYTDQGSGQTTRTIGCETTASAFQVTETLNYDNLNDLTSDGIGEDDTTARSGCDGNSSTTTSTTWYHRGGQYDGLGRTTDVTGNHGQDTHSTYDADGNLASLADALGHTWTYAYNAHNQVASVTAADGGVTRYAYNGAGHLAAVTDPGGRTTSYAWDGFGQLTAVSSPDSGATTYAYDSRGRLVQMIRADGSVTSIQYDADNRPTQVTAGSQVQTYSYDSCANGKTRLCGFTDPSGSTAYSYTPDGQLASQTQVIGGVSYTTSWAYDSRDRATAITDPGGNQIHYTYDTASHVTSVSATINGVTQTLAGAVAYQAHGAGPLTALSLGDGTTTTYTYDTDQRLTALGDGVHESLNYAYDTGDRLTGITDNLTSSLTETLGYDPVSRLTGVTSAGLGNQALAYDANGNRTGHTVGNAAETYALAAGSNQLASVTLPLPQVTLAANPTGIAAGGSSTLSWSSSNASSCSASGAWSGAEPVSGSQSVSPSATSTYSLSCSNLAGSGAASASVTVTQPAPALSLTANPASITAGGSSTLTWSSSNTTSCSASGAWSGTKAVSGSQSVAPSATSTYTLACSGAGGSVTKSASVTVTPQPAPALSLTANPTSITAGGSSTLTWSSSNASSCTASGAWSGAEPVSGSQTVSPTLAGTRTYTLSCSGAGGSVTKSASVNVTSSTCRTCTPTTGPTLTSTSTPSTGTRSFTYDADGNTTAITGLGSNRSFAYDAFNHLSSVNNGGAVTNYSYNALGQRVRKTGAGGNLSYVYAPDGSLLGETASGGSTLATEYVWLPAHDGLPAQPVGVIRGNALYFVHDDHLGRPQVVTNASGAIVWQASNAAFDRSVTTNSFGGLNLGFPGQYYDQESGLYYNLNRYYDPTTGRYLQVDPIGLAGGVNPFVYGFNNPLSFIDPTGLDLLTLGGAGDFFIEGGGALGMV